MWYDNFLSLLDFNVLKTDAYLVNYLFYTFQNFILVLNDVFFQKWTIPQALLRLFSSFQAPEFLQQNVHPVYGAGIRTHDLRYMSLVL